MLVSYMYNVPYKVTFGKQVVYWRKNISVIALWCHHSVIMLDFLMAETQQTIINVHVHVVIILIIYFSYLLKVLVEL